MIAALLLAANVAVASKAPIAQWTDAPGRKTVMLPVSGAVLRGYSYTGKVARGPVLLVFGGSGNLIERHDAAARGYARKASRVVWYDYRGYGFSTGVAHFDDLRSDALKIYDATLAGSTVKRVVVSGYSMGADIAAYVATQRNVAGLILAAPEAAQEVDVKAMVRRIRAPLLVFQDKQLERDAASPDKRFVAVESQAAVAEFLAHVLNL